MAVKTVKPGITRIDLDDRAQHGYFARVVRRGTNHQKWFGDRTCGGKRKALAAAVAWREKKIRELPEPATSRGRRTKRNQSGHVGIHTARDVDRRSMTVNWSFVASWKDGEGRRVKASFGWKKHGRRKAWQLACIARENMITDRAAIERLHSKRIGRYPRLPPMPPGATEKMVVVRPAKSELKAKKRRVRPRKKK